MSLIITTKILNLSVTISEMNLIAKEKILVEIILYMAKLFDRFTSIDKLRHTITKIII